jgi:hypothetical protein
MTNGVPLIYGMNELKKCFLKDYKENVIKELPASSLKDKLVKLSSGHWEHSSVNRLTVADVLAYHFLPEITNTLVISYKIQDTTKRHSTNTYCIAYVNIHPKKHPLNEENPAVSTNLQIIGICTSGSISSKDGEYRSTVTDWYSFQEYLQQDGKIRGFFDTLQRYLMTKMKKRKYLLAIDYFFPNDVMKTEHFFEAEMLASEQKIMLFVISWFNFFFTRMNSMNLGAANEEYAKMLNEYKTEDMHFLKYLFENTNPKVLATFRYLTNNNIKHTSKPDLMQKTKLGQKMFPLNLLEIQHPFHVAFRPWKELLIAKKASQLVLNHITPGFPITGSWILISNSSDRLFDNPDQTKKIKQSGMALSIVDILKQAQVHTYVQNETAIENPTKALNRSTPWISRDFKHIFEQIQHPIDYSNEFLIMSDTSLCVFSEYVGKPLYDVMIATEKSKYYKDLVHPIFSEKGSHFFRTYMFEMIYNLYCLHSLVGVIHGDTHLSNFTLNCILYHNQVITTPKKPKIAYILDPEIYIFEHNYYNLCLIDFSRSILDVERLQLIADETIPDIFPMFTNQKYLERQQETQLLEYLLSLKPEYKENSAFLSNLLKFNFEAMFRVLSCLDIYSASEKLYNFMSRNAREHPISNSSIEFVRKILMLSDNILTTNLAFILDNKNYDSIVAMEWPAKTIIKALFSENLYTNEPVSDIVSLYSYLRKESTSLSSETQFPGMLRKLPPTCFKDKSTFDQLKKQNEQKRRMRKHYEDNYKASFRSIEILRHQKGYR